MATRVQVRPSRTAREQRIAVARAKLLDIRANLLDVENGLVAPQEALRRLAVEVRNLAEVVGRTLGL